VGERKEEKKKEKKSPNYLFISDKFEEKEARDNKRRKKRFEEDFLCLVGYYPFCICNFVI
jgi:hypothetical protein